MCGGAAPDLKRSLLFGLRPEIQGAEPSVELVEVSRKVKDLPHIGRHSRDLTGISFRFGLGDIIRTRILN